MEIEKIAVVYATKTNHSKKLAEAIGTAIKVSAGNITDNPILQDTDRITSYNVCYTKLLRIQRGWKHRADPYPG